MIKVTNLSKRFGSKLAVDDLSFEVGKGEVLGFLGPNGAGKSTTMRMITGFIEPSAGSISVGGIDILKDPIRAKAKIGYLPENAPLYRDMTVVGFLKFVADLRGLTGGAKSQAVDKALETCFLEPVRHQSVDTLSKGYRHRTCLAQSILHDPEILILDEPTDGLDPNQKREVRNLIKRLGETRTVIFSTHILEEVEAACTRAIVIDHGHLVADGTPTELKSTGQSGRSLRVRIAGRHGGELVRELKSVEGISAVESVEEGTDYLVGRIRPGRNVGPYALAEAVSDYCHVNGLRIQEISREEGRLDEVFEGLTS